MREVDCPNRWLSALSDSEGRIETTTERRVVCYKGILVFVGFDTGEKNTRPTQPTEYFENRTILLNLIITIRVGRSLE